MATKEERDCVDALMDKMDDMLYSRDFERFDKFILDFDPGKHSITECLCVLSMSRRAGQRGELKNYGSVVDKISSHIRSVAADRADRLLSGLV